MWRKLIAVTLALSLIFAMAIPGLAAATYIYDELGRLIEINNDSGDRIIYVYDDSGNMTGISVIAANAIEISTPEELNSIRNNLSGSYRLMNDIDLAGRAWEPIGTSLKPFSGTLNGNGFEIKNLTINLPNQDNVGLFGRNGGTIVNLGLEDATITGKDHTGSIAGHNSGNIIECYVSGITHIKGNNNVGGITGNNIGGIIKSYFISDVSGSSYIGGVAGRIAGGVAEQCYAAGSVSAAVSYAGGFSGHISDGSSAIRNCFSTGKVQGGNNSAGFIGFIVAGKIENCYSVSSNANGFSSNGTATNCYFDSDLSSVIKPEGRTTIKMMSQSTYMDWDFEEIWEIDEGLSYPALRVLPKPGASRYIADDIEWLTFELIKGDNEYENEITTNLDLPKVSKNGAAILWTSNDPSVVSAAGVVARPSFGENDAEIVLTAKLMYAFDFENITFNLTVLAEGPEDAEKPNINQLTDVVAVEGDTVTLNVIASVSKGTLSYQWYEVTIDGDIPIEDANQALYTIQTDTPGEWSFYCVITNTDYTATGNITASIISDTVVVTIVSREDAEIPNIIRHPSDVTVLTGDAATLTVEGFVSKGTLSYQWYEKTVSGSTIINGANQATYNAQSGTPGEKSYYCAITNTDNTATGNKTTTAVSEIAIVTVTSRVDAEIPKITAYPGNITVLKDEPATLTVTASVSKGTLSYQWYTTGSNALIVGANQAVYNAPTNTVGENLYYCVITNTDNTVTGSITTSVTGDMLTVKVIEDAETPVITGYPANFNIPVGGTAILTVAASVTRGTLSYQWYEKTVSGNTFINGADQPFYNAPTGLPGEKSYYCVVTNTDNAATGSKTATVISNTVTVTVSKMSLFHNVALDVNGIHKFEDAANGYTKQKEKTVVITNTGTNGTTGLTTAITGGDVDAFIITQPLKTSLYGNDTTAFTVTPNAELQPKTYMSIVSVTGDNNVLVSFIVSFTVNSDSTTVNSDSTSDTTTVQTPESSAEDKTQIVNITINDQPVEAELSSDGTLKITITESFADGSGETNIILENEYEKIIAFTSIPSLKTDDFVITTGFGVIRIPSETLSVLEKEYGDTLKLSVKKGSFIISLLDGKGNEIPYRDSTNPMTLTLPYTLEKNQSSAAVVAVDKYGTVIPHAIHKDGAVTFDITETGTYDVVYKDTGLTDVSGHWAEDYISFAAARGLYTMYGTRFDPDGAMTRAMFVQALAAVEGVDLSAYTVSRFSDVSSNIAAIEWAAGAGIVQGVGNGRFDPNAAITREQMAALLNNYMEHKGYIPQSNAALSVFTDEDTISSWALDAVKTIQALGIITGKPGNLFDPNVTATRAEAAVIFTRFIEFEMR